MPRSTKTIEEKITNIEEQIRQLENSKKQLLQQQKMQESKERDRRLCKRGAYLESTMPDTVPLTDEQSYQFINKTLQTDYARKILDSLKKQTVGTAQENNAAGTSANVQGKVS